MPPDEAKKKPKSSLALRIFNVYLLLTLTNLVILWLAAGANQIRLINKNALLNTKIVAEDLVEMLMPFLDNEKYLENNIRNSKLSENAINELNQAVKKTAGVKEFAIISSKGTVLYQNFAKFKFTTPLPDKMQKRLFHALQLRELNNQRAYRTPDVINYYIEIFVPLSLSKDENYSFYSRIDMPSIKEEVRALIVLAVAMVVLILIVQTLFGFILYRMIVLPVRNLSEGAERVGAGDLSVEVTRSKRNDSISRLIDIFNRMTSSLHDKTSKLENTIAALESHDRMMRNELVLAEQIQRGIMPTRFENTLIRASFYYAPMGKVSGDYYDIFELGENSVGVVIADISGHGMPAALISMMAKIHFNENATRFKSTSQLLKKVNDLLAEGIPTAEYLTAFYLILDKQRNLRFSNSAHPPVIYYNHKKKAVETLTTKGSLMGAFTNPAPKFVEKRLKLHKGDRLVLFTDGLTEVESPKSEIFGQERLINLVAAGAKKTIDELKFSIIEELNYFLAENNAKDDQTLIILELK